MTELDDRILDITNAVHISTICPSLNRKYNTCPACGGKSKLAVFDDKTYICFRSGCELSFGRRDVIGLYMYLNNYSTPQEFYKTLEELEVLGGIQSRKTFIKARSSILTKAMDIYQYTLWTSEGSEALSYLKNRGLSEECITLCGIGYANNNLLEYDLDISELKSEGLVRGNSEYFYNHIIFPIRDYTSNLVHLQGRLLSGDGLRYKDTVAGDLLSSKKYFYLEDRLPLYKDYVVITEGAPDALSLIESSINGLGVLGLQNISSHYSKLKSFDTIIFAFDSDRFEEGRYKGQFKSWTKVFPQLVDLQCLLPKCNIKVWTSVYSKDINELLVSRGSRFLKKSIFKESRPLVDVLIDLWGGDLSKHKELIKLVAATGTYKDKLRSLIEDKDPLDYAIRVFS